MRFLCVFGLLLGAVSVMAEPIKVKVVVVAMFERGEDAGDLPGEFQYWVEREGLTETYAFPQGHRDLRGSPDGAVLGVVTGIGTAKSAATIMAVGLDPRFDLTEAYWIVAGISGVDPADMALGSAAWAEWLIDGDLSHQIDYREVPDGWPTGYIPLRKARPFQQPVDGSEGQVFRLVPSLVEWAYQLTKGTELMDTEAMQKRRALYEGYPVAQRRPFVLKGDQLAAMTYWHGEILNEWANEWVDYYTEGQGEFVTSAMEDTGTYTSLAWLDRAGKVDVERLLVLRTASNFTMQWPGGDAAESLSGEKLGPGYSAYIPSLDAAHKVGSQVLRAILAGWETYQYELPTP
jgi:purine nucleoside permease